MMEKSWKIWKQGESLSDGLKELRMRETRQMGCLMEGAFISIWTGDSIQESLEKIINMDRASCKCLTETLTKANFQ